MEVTVPQIITNRCVRGLCYVLSSALECSGKEWIYFMDVLETIGLHKTIKGNAVLNDINLKLYGGMVYAFQGENGSGKTMLFRVLSGLSMPTSGCVRYNGMSFAEGQPDIGVVIENASLFPQFTGFQNLSYLAGIKKVANSDAVVQALLRVGLDPKDKRTVRKYSLGMKQRLLIAQAIMEQPAYIFLDEPTNAIDKDGVNLVYKIIKEEASRGAVVLLTSHIDNDVSQLADCCFHMKNGEIVDEKHNH